MSHEEMIRTLQNRMNMIPTARVTNTNTSRDNIHGGEEPDEVDNEMTDEEWEEYQRDMDDNPEPINQEEE